MASFINLKQKYSWDCGPTCVAMIVRASGNAQYSIEAIYKMIVAGNVWTIDLAYILSHFGMDFIYYTTYTGVNVDHGELDFYKAILAEDTPRINKLFEEANHKGVKVEKKSVELEILKEHTSKGMPAIVLVDNRHIERAASIKPPTNTKTPLKPIKFPFVSLICTGHYILVYGYDPSTDLFEFFDPNDNYLGPYWIKSEFLELARKSSGTDEDLLLVNLK